MKSAITKMKEYLENGLMTLEAYGHLDKARQLEAEEKAKAPAGDCEGLKTELIAMIKRRKAATSEPQIQCCEIWAGEIETICARYPTTPEAHNNPATRWEESIREGEAQRPKAPVNLLELKKWVISERDRMEITGGLIDGFLTALHNKIDELTAPPVEELIAVLCKEAYETSKSKGWKHDNDGQAIALMHSELSEALEAMRKPEKKDEHLPDLDPVGLELADVLIRVFDFCGARKIDLAICVKEKMAYNKNRPSKHGGKLF